MPRLQAGRQAGFTLIELLVVISMIAVLLALAAGTYFRVRNAAVNHDSEIMDGKLASAMDQQMKAVIAQAREEWANGQVPCDTSVQAPAQFIATLMTIAGGDRRRAQSLYIKMRIKQEFPQSFAEARTPVVLGFPSSPGPGPGVAVLPMKQNYLRALANASPNPANNIPLNRQTGLPKYWPENAACLYMVLSTARRGAPVVRAEELGANAVTETLFQNVNNTSPPVSLRMYQDASGIPIHYCRWPIANDELAQLGAQLGGGDTQDPETLLYQSNPTNVSWITALNTAWGANYNYNILQFQLHTLSTQRHNPMLPVVPHDLSPVIISGGLSLGLDPPYPTQNPDPNTNPPLPPPPYRDYLDYYLMTLVDTASPPGTGDDILSFRLRKTGARGD